MTWGGSYYVWREQLAGAVDFNGTAGLGLFDPSDANLGFEREKGWCPKIIWLAYEADGTPHQVSWYMSRNALNTQGNDRVRLGGSRIDDLGALTVTNWATIACPNGLPWIPVDGPGIAAPFYDLQLYTTGKMALATWTVVWIADRR